MVSTTLLAKSLDEQNDVLRQFQDRVRQRTARVGVVGMGYVGLPIALLFAKKNFHTTGFDIDPAKIESLRQGTSYIKHIPDSEIEEEIQRNQFLPTTDFTRLSAMDAIIICVPTPLDDHREPDLSFIRATAESISGHLRRGQLVVLESTTYPGTTEEVVLPILEKSGLRCPVSDYSAEANGQADSGAAEVDFLLAFSPEREDPGNKNFKTHQVPKVIGGVNALSVLATRDLYETAFEHTVLVSSSRAAEMTKLLENIYRCVNIALVNELKLLCLRMGLDIWEIIDAAKTKPFGFSAFYPGPGLGGHCIPIDPFYLTWKAREYDFPTRFIELAGEINASMPEHVIAATGEALNRRRKCLNNARILVLGVSYKKDVDDLRESPSLAVMELLQARGVRVDYHDPYFPHLGRMRRYNFQLDSVPLSEETLSQYDAVLITTDHSSFDYEFVVQHSQLVIDTRNATRDITECPEKIVHC
ncbi:MAG TPA: nucleotide sugar dehydrogenase [Terriglobia bacterium]|nr:nucleotide sugar dehydrogenase [Terriglobia bacterium]